MPTKPQTPPTDRVKKLLQEKALEATGGKILRTAAQEAKIQIINERPEGMPIEVYKALRRKQTKDIRRVLR